MKAYGCGANVLLVGAVGAHFVQSSHLKSGTASIGLAGDLLALSIAVNALLGACPVQDDIVVWRLEHGEEA